MSDKWISFTTLAQPTFPSEGQMRVSGEAASQGRVGGVLSFCVNTFYTGRPPPGDKRG